MPTKVIQEIVEWPTSEGYWMGNIPDVGWIPMKAKYLLNDLPPDVGKPLAIVVQFPESEKSWPFLFSGSHPAKQWRHLTEDEKILTQRFYGEYF